MYNGPLFLKKRAWVEAQGFDAWFILSALHHILDPDEVIEPYDYTLATYVKKFGSAAAVGFWARDVMWQFAQKVQRLTGRHHVHDLRIYEGIKAEFHAGADYVEPLLHEMNRCGIPWTWPLKGMGIGQQIQAYGSSWSFSGLWLDGLTSSPSSEASPDPHPAAPPAPPSADPRTGPTESAG